MITKIGIAAGAILEILDKKASVEYSSCRAIFPQKTLVTGKSGKSDRPGGGLVPAQRAGRRLDPSCLRIGVAQMGAVVV